MSSIMMSIPLLCVLLALPDSVSSLAFSTSFSKVWGSGSNSQATDFVPPLAAVASTTSAIFDPVQIVKQYSRTAITEYGSEQGLLALEDLGRISAKRESYDFASTNSFLEGSVLAPQRQILPKDTMAAFLRQVRIMEENGWLSTNPDSVDGLPSLHLNLISGGRPLFSKESMTNDDFQHGIANLIDIVEPHLYNDLLPTVQNLMNSTEVIISDVFLRRYGQDIAGDNARQGISAHYDVFSVVTAVIALDDVAAKGDNGLYTTATSKESGETSNHASLRRFFPLKSGDGVVHSWDVLHGVDVEPGLDRTSLIVWFSTKEAMMDSEINVASGEKSISPWLTGHPKRQCNDAVQFVLASALESASTSESNDDIDNVATISVRDSDSNLKDLDYNNPQELYLESASRGNAFAWTRLGSLCQEGTIQPDLIPRIVELLEKTTSGKNDELFPSVAGRLLFASSKNDSDDHSFVMGLARRLWLQGALCGNPQAQMSLGDEIMELAVKASTNDKDNYGKFSSEWRLLAATLFGLAAQQEGSSSTCPSPAMDALSRVMQYEASLCESQEEFSASPVLKVAQTALSEV